MYLLYHHITNNIIVPSKITFNAVFFFLYNTGVLNVIGWEGFNIAGLPAACYKSLSVDLHAYYGSLLYVATSNSIIHNFTCRQHPVIAQILR